MRCGQGHRQVQDGQALRTRHHRDRVRLPPQGRRHRRRSRPRWPVHRAHQRARHRARCRAHRARLQGIERRRACVPQPQDGGPESAPDLSLRWRPRARPRLPVHARLLCRMAHAPTAQTVAVRRTRSPTWPRLLAPSIVAPAEVSPSAQDKARRKRTASGEPVHSFRTLLDDLATVANNRVVAPLADAKPFDLITRPTALQRKAFKLLGVRLERTQ